MDHLSYATFYRYFIADVVTEDRALYLDLLLLSLEI